MDFAAMMKIRQRQELRELDLISRLGKDSGNADSSLNLVLPIQNTTHHSNIFNTFHPRQVGEMNSGSENSKSCAECKTMVTPLWRNGPQGHKTLCNACGLHFKRQE